MGCPLPRRKCLGVIALSKTKLTGLTLPTCCTILFYLAVVCKDIWHEHYARNPIIQGPLYIPAVGCVRMITERWGMITIKVRLSLHHASSAMAAFSNAVMPLPMPCIRIQNHEKKSWPNFIELLKHKNLLKQKIHCLVKSDYRPRLHSIVMLSKQQLNTSHKQCIIMAWNFGQ